MRFSFIIKTPFPLFKNTLLGLFFSLFPFLKNEIAAFDDQFKLRLTPHFQKLVRESKSNIVSNVVSVIGGSLLKNTLFASKI